MYVHKLNLKKTKFMNKMIMNRLTMLAVTLMASMACFAQGKLATSIPGGLTKDAEFDYMELKYKIIDAESSYEVKVIGFAEAFKTDPSQFDNAEEGVEIHHHNEVFIPHYIGQDDKVAVNVYVSSVAEGALNTTDSELAGKVTALVIDYQDNNKTQGIPMIIGAKAFAGLKSLTEVKNLTPGAKITDISSNSFANVVYNNATLVVPSGNENMGLYMSKTGWENFMFIRTQTSSSYFLDINNDNDIDGKDLIAFEDAMLFEDYDGMNEESLDINGDGIVDGRDLLALEDILLFR